ncbi:MAG: ABC transporter permease [Rickettsiales bacterium]
MHSNLVIFNSLTRKEITRFLKVYHQAIISPVITGLIFFLIFRLATGNGVEKFSGLTYTVFVGSGIIVMTMMQQSFSNSSSSITISKVHGTIVDYLVTPISSHNFVLSYSAASIIRGLLVGALLFPFINYFAHFKIHSPLILMLSTILGVSLLSIFGVIVGLISQNFEQMSSFTSYLVTPLSFLSGTFYSIKKLPHYFESLNLINPLFYSIDLFRYGMTGYSDRGITEGLTILFIANIALYLIAIRIFKTGYRIKE